MIGNGSNNATDGTQNTYVFARLHGICSFAKVLFVTDVAARAVKIVTGLCGTISFLKMLGSLHDTLGIQSKGASVKPVSLKMAKTNTTKITKYVQDTVAKIKGSYNMKDSAVTNGPEGTVSTKTQASFAL